jgi:hypothetical protein
MAFVADCRMVANLWLRSGNTSSVNNMYSFLEDTLQKLQARRLVCLRADSGFYGEETFRYLEERTEPVNYIIAARLYNPVQRKISQQKLWLKLGDGIEVGETQYCGLTGTKARRLVIVRQHVPERPKATGKQLKLFQDSDTYNNYRFIALLRI